MTSLHVVKQDGWLPHGQSRVNYTASLCPPPSMKMERLLFVKEISPRREVTIVDLHKLDSILDIT
jgi:hypothetical protein